MENKNKIILGIDPGYDRLGVAIIEKISNSESRLIFSTCLLSNKKENLNDRIFNLCENLKMLIEKYGPTELSIEKLFFTTNQKTAMGVAEARGAIIYTSKTLGLQVYEYTPLQIKIALTGYGKADKSQVDFMVKKLLNIKEGGVNENKKLDDEYDAIACSLTHAASVK